MKETFTLIRKELCIFSGEAIIVLVVCFGADILFGKLNIFFCLFMAVTKMKLKHLIL